MSPLHPHHELKPKMYKHKNVFIFIIQLCFMICFIIHRHNKFDIHTTSHITKISKSLYSTYHSSQKHFKSQQLLLSTTAIFSYLASHRIFATPTLLDFPVKSHSINVPITALVNTPASTSKNTRVAPEPFSFFYYGIDISQHAPKYSFGHIQKIYNRNRTKSLPSTFLDSDSATKQLSSTFLTNFNYYNPLKLNIPALMLVVPFSTMLDVPAPTMLDVPVPTMLDVPAPTMLDVPAPTMLDVPAPTMLDVPASPLPTMLDMPVSWLYSYCTDSLNFCTDAAPLWTLCFTNSGPSNPHDPGPSAAVADHFMTAFTHLASPAISVFAVIDFLRTPPRSPSFM
jgi:hypothetical protein